MVHKKKCHHEEEEHVNHERWMVTYADMVTLLMVLFIVMFAISQVDQKKFAALSEGLAKDFGAPNRIVNGQESILDDSGAAPAAIDIAAQLEADPDTTGGKPGQEDAGTGSGKAGDQVDDPALAAALEAARHERDSLEHARAKITAALEKAGMKASVRFTLDDRGLTVSIVTDRVFFLADSATLQRPGQRLLAAVAPALNDLPNPIAVEGHTNTVPVKPKYYPTEWELSSARAVTVVRYLVEHRGVAGRRLEAAGFADKHPLLPASDPRSTELNRRVDIVVLSTLNATQRAALAAAGPTAG
jgi:chemotaxis protein MotB